MAQAFERFLVASNRLPIVLEKMNERWEVQPGSGGLVTALTPLMKDNHGTWVGWPGVTGEEDLKAPIQEFASQQGYSLHPVSLSDKELQGYYHGFANEVLWPLLHGFHTKCNLEPGYWEQYQTVNDRFAQELVGISKENDFIWVHDYHLMLVASGIKKGFGQRNCCYFHHIPFPGPDIFLKLPWRLEILNALLDFRLLGFQTNEDVINFLRCLEAVFSDVEQRFSQGLYEIKCGSRATMAGAFPISIDFDYFAGRAKTDEVSQATAKLKRLHVDQQVILGIDRLDYTKGILERLEALRYALEHFPDLRGNLSLIQVLIPSRQQVPEYQNLKERIQGLIGEINGQFTEPGWIPIQYLYRSLSQDELVSFYLAADIALLTPLWDGMNLVAKEYCACSHHENNVLILSEFAGAASQMFQDALLVNPHHVVKVAQVIRRAYYMHKSERSERMKRLRESVRKNDIFFWLRTYLEAAFEGKSPIGSRERPYFYLSERCSEDS